MKKRSNLDFLIPLIVVLVFGFINLVGIFSGLDNRVYDAFLHVKRDTAEDKSLLIVDIDDQAISKVGQWPWSRNVMADGLITMREFGARYATFDIEYVDPSPLGVNGTYLEHQIPQFFNQEFSDLSQNITSLFGALTSGSISIADAQDYVQQLSGITDDTRKLLLDKVQGIARDNDTYLGQAAWFFNKAFFTVNFPDQPQDNAPDYVSWTLDNIALKNVVVKGNYGHEYHQIHPAIPQVLKKAAGAGFPLVIVDPDGVRRRVELVVQYKGKYFAQLAFRPLLDYLGNPEVDLYKNKIVLRGAQVPGKGVRDVSIPLAPDGNFVINWPKRHFYQSFRHLGYYSLVLYQSQEASLMTLLRAMSDANYLSFAADGADFFKPFDDAERIKEQILNGGDPQLISGYRDLRASFFKSADAFLNGNAQDKILAQIDAALSTRGITDAQRAQFTAVRKDVTDRFTQARQLSSDLLKNRETLSKALGGAFCIIGDTATSQTDLGVNPFEKSFPNVGTHASVANTILGERFVDFLPSWYSTVLVAVLGFGLFLIIRRLEPLPSILIGFGTVVVFVGAGVALFAATRLFLDMTAATLAVFVTFVVQTVIKFLTEAREKSYIRNAFGRYLSGDVINELIANPDKLSLGGDKKVLTAMFTDVKGFSTVSEQLDPSDLVHLLNAYLTEMSDIILQERGTIDKYEGDAIISFFGAPVTFEDHPRKACAAALRMKKAEAILNQRFLSEQVSPTPLLTRIGINTGEMVVGNMGTDSKMDYTIMGNSVNLAARLEGVNKQYGTWILVSEWTQAACPNDFLFRMLDRVRVVGIHQPVRLYELAGDVNGQSGGADPAAALVARFHEAIELFEQKEWESARVVFQSLLTDSPEDGPSKVYVKRCEDFIKTPPPANWDGVFNLSMK